MKRNSVWAILAGVFLALLLVLAAVRVFFPRGIVFYIISVYALTILLLLCAHMVSRKPNA